MNAVEMNISIDEIRQKSVHDDLLRALCLLKQSRNIIHKVKGEKELEDHYERLDHIQTDLNDEAGWIGEIISDVMYCRIDDLV